MVAMSVSDRESPRAELPDGSGVARVPANPLVSVCITNHDYGRYLGAAIESVLGQTYPRVELIVVDDRSTDDSRDVIDGYAGRLVPVLLEERAGQSAAGWAGVQAASGDVVIFLDADDLLDPHICAEVAYAFSREPELALVQWRLRRIDEEGNVLPRALPPRPGLLPSGDLSEHVLRVRNWYYQLTSGVAYAMWVARRILPADLPAGELHALDHWLNELAPLLGPIRSLDQIGSSHRTHDESFSESFSARDEGTAAWSRRLLGLTLNTHQHVRRLAAERGLRCPERGEEVRDPAFLGWQLLSLALEPERHPFEGDSRLRLAARGVTASLLHPHFPWRHRLKRALWFAAVGTLPRPAVRRITARYAGDVPLAAKR